MNNNVFKRVEEKYLITNKEKEMILNEIDDYIEKDLYFETIICSIYYDNINQDLIINSLEKPIYKDKVRLRSYGIPNLDDNVFLEIKNKYKSVVNKRRVKMTLQDFYNYLDGKLVLDNQIMKEIDYLFKYYELRPNIFIAYDRQSYKDKASGNVRITFDNNLRSRRDNLRLEYGDDGDKYLDEKIYIMEIKTLGSMPLWLVKTLSKLKIYPKSYSKYGTKYLQEMREMK